MKDARRAVDWDKARARLEQAHQALEKAAGRSPEEVQHLLRERARALAKPAAEASLTGEMATLVVFSLAGEQYAVETSHVSEVVPLRELTRIPGTPTAVLGVMNHRGRILPVLDLRRLFDLTGQEVAEGSRVVAVEAGGMTFGILAEAVTGTARVEAAAIAPPPAGPTGIHRTFIRGVTPEMIVVLDLEALAQDPRITVNEQTG